MENPFQPNLRRPWLLLCTTLLVVYSIMPGAHRTLFFDAAPSSFIEAVMALLSFPLGTAVAFVFHSPELGVRGRVLFWALAMGLGYAQWFHLLPALRRRERQRRMHTQNPDAAPSVAPASPLGLRAATAAPALDSARAPVPEFDERGRTPLERIFRDGE